jgi:hypothetical protein
MLMCSTEIVEVAKAILQVQGKVSGVTKDAKADAGRRVYKYATLDAVISEVRDACVSAGLVLLQAPSLDHESGVVAIETRLVHAASGQWMACSSSCAANAGDAQSVGSAQTYMRRYGLMALLGLAAEDDDGQAARGAPTGQPQPARYTSSDAGRQRIVDRLQQMRQALNLQVGDYNGLSEQELIAEGTKLRKQMDERGVK